MPDVTTDIVRPGPVASSIGYIHADELIKRVGLERADGSGEEAGTN
jgi:hypothetical protein